MRISFWGSTSDQPEAGPSQAAEAAPKAQPDASEATAATPNPTAAAEPPLSRYARALSEEEKIQDQQFPNYEDIPKCMQLL